MKIERSQDGSSCAPAVRRELQAFLQSDRPKTAVCAPHCPDAGPGRCGRRCPDMPRMLSSDPERFPLEGRIAPLVYELKRLEVFEPCWSCEGHNGTDGTLWKRPAVWFYCRSVVPLRVLYTFIKDLHVKGDLAVPWRIVVTYSDPDNPDTTFSLEPSADDPGVSLDQLQRDIDRIAAQLPSGFDAQARKLSRFDA